jgi:hypothetical protein
MSNEQQFNVYHRKDAGAAYVVPVTVSFSALVSYLMRIQVSQVVMLSGSILHSQHSFKLSYINNPATQHSNLKDQKPQISQVTSCKY